MSDVTQIGLSFLEGLGLAASPCILPVLPFILAASAQDKWWRPFMIIAGFIGSFTIFSLVARQILAATGLQQDTIQTGAYILLLLFGLVMVIPILEEKFAALTGGLANRAQAAQEKGDQKSVLGALGLGALIGLVWTPCAGPLLAAVLLQVIQAKTTIEAVASLFAFAVGAGVPMLMIALFGQQLTTHIRGFSKHAPMVRRVMGVVIISFAALSLGGFNLGIWVTEQQAKAEQQQVAMLDGQRLEGALAQPYPAPEVMGIHKWFNSEALTLESLRGKVVLIDFWTYSCINCIRTLPYVKNWYAQYKDDGLVVLGVHAPEFAFEGQPVNVQKAIEKFGITYPVAMDNDFATWNNYKNRYWPAHYLIDREGRVVYVHFGEGKYDVTENNIRVLLGLGKAGTYAASQVNTVDGQTHETYLGTARAKNETRGDVIPLHHWKVMGDWKRTGQFIESVGKGDQVTLHYNARKVFLVMESADGKPVYATVTHNGAAGQKTADVQDGRAKVEASRLYELVDMDKAGQGQLTITADRAGLRLYAFTFQG